MLPGLCSVVVNLRVRLGQLWRPKAACIGGRWGAGKGSATATTGMHRPMFQLIRQGVLRKP